MRADEETGAKPLSFEVTFFVLEVFFGDLGVGMKSLIQDDGIVSIGGCPRCFLIILSSFRKLINPEKSSLESRKRLLISFSLSLNVRRKSTRKH